ncbi:MAG: flagellin [Eubacteriales bacterium]
MRINHNLSAMNTYSRLTNANTAQSNSLEKLSSGLRINKAGDDAAGLAISEKMRGQIGGLNQAVRNAQDGISLIQTAEGALSETHSILQRMRELAVQGTNDTNTADDRVEIQKELDQLKAEIDRIGNTTEFNTKRLVDGSQAQQAALTSGGTNIVSAKAVNPMDEGDYGVTITNEEKTAANINASTTGIDDAAKITAFGVNVDIGDSFSIVVSNYDGGANTADVTLLDGEGNNIASLTGEDITGAIAIGGDDGLTIAAASITGDGTATLDFGMEADYRVTREGVTIQSLTDVVSTNGEVSIGGFELTVDNTLAAAADAEIAVSGKALQFQVGANENQSIRLAMSDMRSAALGVDQITVDNYDNAKAAISTIDDAISDVSGERSKLGSIQNRLDHTINNLTTTSENLTAAESRIRDVDMAKEMMEFTKNNILSQAATSMLAQANQMPQSVLQLLQ